MRDKLNSIKTSVTEYLSEKFAGFSYKLSPQIFQQQSVLRAISDINPDMNVPSIEEMETVDTSSTTPEVL